MDEHEFTLCVAFGKRYFDNRPVTQEISIADLAVRWAEPTPRGSLSLQEYLQANPQTQKLTKDGTYFIPAQMNGGRQDSNVIACTGFVFDIDSGNVAEEDISRTLSAYQYLAYLTYSSAPDNRKWRIVIFYAKPIEGARQEAVFNYWQSIVSWKLDPRAKVPSQLWYEPACPKDATQYYRFINHPGRLFDAESVTPQYQQKASVDATGDIILDTLYQRGLVLGQTPKGAWCITCPWESEHTTGSDKTSTVYFPAHTGGHPGPAFDCKHAHCAKRNIQDLTRFLGIPIEPVGTVDGRPRSYSEMPDIATLVATEHEMYVAKLTPLCYIDKYLYQDIAVFSAPGSMSKTTIGLWEAMHLILEKPLYGRRVYNSGLVLYITAEDSREVCLARIRKLGEGLGLSAHEMRKIRESLLIWDVSGSTCRLAEQDRNNNVVPTGLAEHIVSKCQGLGLAVVQFDPLVSFGAGERFVNDNEQAVITAARSIRKGLGCCVRLTHHTGQAVARGKLTDQYASRGGTALPDGSRMHVVGHAMADPTEWPPGMSVKPEERLLRLTIAKMSCAEWPQSDIWLKREGWSFEYVPVVRGTPEEESAARADQLERFLVSELKKPEPAYHTRRSLRDKHTLLKMTVAQLNEALATLESSQKVYEKDLPKDERRGRRTMYLHPALLVSER